MKTRGDTKGITGVQLKEEHAKKSRACSKCKVEKTWKFLKRNGMKAIYVDDENKRWNSSTCHTCYREKFGNEYVKKIIKKKVKRVPAYKQELNLDELQNLE